MTSDVKVIMMDMPTTIRSYVRANPDGSYSIIINAKLSRPDQQKCCLHELQHIANGDFDVDRTESVQEIETRAHSSAPDQESKHDAFIRMKLAQIRKRKKALDRKLNRLQRKAEEKDSRGYDFLRAEAERWLDPDRRE